MTPTPRQREEWDNWRKVMLKDYDEKICEIESQLEYVVKERDRLEEMTFEDSYFEFLAGRGSEK